jgi:aminocarboxymuconate-semialdehyde decarboxylase
MPRFYYDTITHSPEALRYLIDRVGASRILLGSDYCFDMGYERPVDVILDHPGLTRDEREQILGGNARNLLGLLPAEHA